jgi:hypothetical protein
VWEGGLRGDVDHEGHVRAADRRHLGHVRTRTRAPAERLTSGRLTTPRGRQAYAA